MKRCQFLPWLGSLISLIIEMASKIQACRPAFPAHLVILRSREYRATMLMRQGMGRRHLLISRIACKGRLISQRRRKWYKMLIWRLVWVKLISLRCAGSFFRVREKLNYWTISQANDLCRYLYHNSNPPHAYVHWAYYCHSQQAIFLSSSSYFIHS